MNVSAKIIDVLNKDEKARKILSRFNEKAREEGIEGEDYDKAREVILMLCIKNNAEAMDMMAREVYNELNKFE